MVAILALKSAVLQKPFEAESDKVTAARILSPPTTNSATTLKKSATTVSAASDARYSTKHTPR